MGDKTRQARVGAVSIYQQQRKENNYVTFRGNQDQREGHQRAEEGLRGAGPGLA
jgi:hypothetical protein